MAHFAVVVDADRLSRERLYADDLVTVPDAAALSGGDEVALLSASGRLFGLGRATAGGAVRYTHRLLDDPLPVDLALAEGTWPLAPDAYAELAGRVDESHRVGAGRRAWLVQVSLPVEAASAAEAVRAFWSYVRDLGPTELPTYVSPSGDELAMQVYVLGEESNQDPEED